jgi:CRP-like cAMP-binding protein
VPETYDIAQLGLREDSEVQALLLRCADIESRRYRDGEFLMREGEDSSDLFIILDGACVVERPAEAPGAPASILATINVNPEHPAILGEMAYFGTQRRSASVRSVGSTHTLCLHPHHIEIIVEAFPGLLRLIFRQFTQRLLESNQTLKEMQARLSLTASRRMGSPGEVLFTQGEPASTLFQLVVGEVRLEGEGISRNVGPEDLNQGFLDLEDYLKGDLHCVTATVEQMAFLVTVDANQREIVVRNQPGLVLDLLRQKA